MPDHVPARRPTPPVPLPPSPVATVPGPPPHRPSSSRSPWRRLTAAVGVLASACTPSVPDTGATGPGAGAPPGLEEFYRQELSWRSCAPFAVTTDDAEALADPVFDCAMLRVPLDYAEPAGESASIAVSRRRATGDRIGSLVINPGGPGEAGLAAPSDGGLADRPVAERFDLVGFDPRGIGASTPAIDCRTDAEEERVDAGVDPSSTEVALLEAGSREFVDRCVERSGVELLANVGTRDVVRDLDVLRAALDEGRLTYLGYSYGSFVGAEYAEAFPDRVRALLLDGAVDPAQDPVEVEVEQAAAFQRAFDAFAADCATRPDCPLGTDPAGATAAFQQLTRPLLDRPVPLEDGRELGHVEVVTATVQALYSSQEWTTLRAGLQQLASGSGEALMALADGSENPAEDGGYDQSVDAFTAVTCVDNLRITDPAVYLEIDTRYRQVAPFRDDGRGPSGARPPCAFWPVPPTTEPAPSDVEGLDPVLVISVTGDPATPYEAGVRLAEQLGARLLTVEGDQHGTAFVSVSECVDDVAAEYLVDLRLPDEGSTCTADG